MFKHWRNNDEGFTLVELLVVIIIIGILAAVAIPAFLNQRQRANDSAVQSDVKNVSAEVETLMTEAPDATVFTIGEADAQNKATITVGNGTSTSPASAQDLSVSGASSQDLNVASAYPQSVQTAVVPNKTGSVTLTKGVVIALEAGAKAGSYKVYGWHENGKQYNARALVFDSANGGLQKATVTPPTGVPTTKAPSNAAPAPAARPAPTGQPVQMTNLNTRFAWGTSGSSRGIKILPTHNPLPSDITVVEMTMTQYPYTYYFFPDANGMLNSTELWNTYTGNETPTFTYKVCINSNCAAPQTGTSTRLADGATP